MKEETKLYFIYPFFAKLGDCISTIIALNVGCVESNPHFAFWLNELGYLAFPLSLNFTLMGFNMIYLPRRYYYKKLDKKYKYLVKYYDYCAWFFIFLLLMVTVNNLVTAILVLLS